MIGAVQAAMLGVLRSGITYILNWASAGASDASFADGDVLDTAAEGIVSGAGSRTVKIPTAGTVAISSGVFSITHDASSGYVECGIQDNFGSTKVIGRALVVGAVSTIGNVSFHCGTSNSLQINSLYTSSQTNGQVYDKVGVAWTPINFLNNAGTVYNDHAIICGGFDSSMAWSHSGVYGAVCFCKKRNSSTWSLANIYVGNNTNQLYGSLTNYSATSVLHNDYAKIVDIPVTNFSPIYTTAPDLLVHDIGVSDFVQYFSLTTPGALPSAAPTYLDFNYQDSNNFWRIKILPAASGTTITLHKVLSGVEGTALTTRAKAFTPSTTYLFCLVKRGTAYRTFIEHNSFGNTSAHSSYTVNDSQFSTSTSFQFTPGSQTLNFQAIWKADGYTFTI